MTRQNRIDSNPRILAGKPVIRGTRLSVEFIVELVAQRWSHERILQNYPQLMEEDIWAAMRYASDAVRQVRILSFACSSL